MTERLSYEILTRYNGFELRQYPQHILVQRRVRGGFMSAPNMAFQSLVNFIGGRNQSSQRIAMTAPVLQEQVDHSDEAHLVSFVMPIAMKPTQMPAPTDPSLKVTVVEPKVMAAVAFRGGWNETEFKRQGERFLESVREAGLSAVGEIVYARFDPPWKPGFLKHNEAMVEIADHRKGQ
jgi:SOUL heme-binding protein